MATKRGRTEEDTEVTEADVTKKAKLTDTDAKVKVAKVAKKAAPRAEPAAEETKKAAVDKLVRWLQEQVAEQESEYWIKVYKRDLSDFREVAKGWEDDPTKMIAFLVDSVFNYLLSPASDREYKFYTTLACNAVAFALGVPSDRLFPYMIRTYVNSDSDALAVATELWKKRQWWGKCAVPVNVNGVNGRDLRIHRFFDPDVISIDVVHQVVRRFMIE